MKQPNQGRKARSKVSNEGPHLKLRLFYKRSYEVCLRNDDEVSRWLEAKALTSDAVYYVEVWSMNNETDGELVEIRDEDNCKLQVMETPKVFRAKLVK